MGFELKGTPSPVMKVAANLDDVRPDQGQTVSVPPAAPKAEAPAEKDDKEDDGGAA